MPKKYSFREKNDLADSFRRAGEECGNQSSMTVTCSVIGGPRDLHPIVRDEVYRIGFEAIRNACTHSRGSRLEIELKYAQDLTLRVGDNGIGIDPVIINRGREGHFGLQGMRERAARIGGKVVMVSSPESGTHITVVVPGNIIFRRNRVKRRPKMLAFLQRIVRGSKS